KFACAIVASGVVRCWGDNSSNQFANGGQPAFSATSLQVATQSAAVAVTAGANHACVIGSTGTVRCWGANNRGQLGNNSTQPAAVVVDVQGLTYVVSISAGAFFTCAVQAAGIASCWGANDSGELGAKDSVNHLTPTLVVSSVFSLPAGGVTGLSLSGIVAI